MMDLKLDPPKALLAALPKLEKRARRLADTQELADDMVQEVALRILTRLSKGEDITDVEAYGMIALRNLARQTWRDRKQTSQLEEHTITALPVAFGVLACKEIAEAIENLPRDQAELMSLVLLGVDRPTELADHCSIPVGTVNSRLARARSQLRKAIGLKKDTSVTNLLS